MFEAAELGRSLTKREFDEHEPQLHTQLLETQREAWQQGLPVIVVVSGVEGAGKSEVVNRLYGWLDTRGVRTFAFWDETDEERRRPAHWRFWRRLPARGRIGILFGSWYTQPIIDRAFDRIDAPTFDRRLEHIEAHERMLVDDGAVLVKLWFHIPKTTQRRRIEARHADHAAGAGERRGWKLSPLVEEFNPHYDRLSAASEEAIRKTDTGVAAWHIIEAEDERYRDLTAGQILLASLRDGLARQAASDAARAARAEQPPTNFTSGPVTVLDRVDLDQSLSKKEYHRQLEDEQRRLHDLAWAARNARRSLLALFEGWDASGKGGAIRRVAGALDARLFQVIPIGAPNEEERSYHYLWRFWRHLPMDGYLTIFDRTWYGRVLVERVEGFCSGTEWRRAYLEINRFEDLLTEHGMGIVKFWIHISKDEQLARFEERETTPWKEHKLGDEDWRNREKWNAYAGAVDDMVARTSTSHSPWVLVAGNCKRFARVQVVRTIADSIEALLDR